MESAFGRIFFNLKIPPNWEKFWTIAGRHARNFSSPTGPLSNRFADGPGLKDFIPGDRLKNKSPISVVPESMPYIDPFVLKGRNRKVYFDVYGCQMNVNDTEIVWSILQSAGYCKTDRIEDADVILMMTCAIREKAEKKVWNKLTHYRAMKRSRSEIKNKPSLKIGVLGCMAERLKHELVEKDKAIDIVAGPDSYKDLPRLLAITDSNETAINVALSLDETYADVVPVRLNQDSVTAYVSIMRGCDNMCTYCIVPFTRGRERSRPAESILREVQELSRQGIKEVTLLGQNVNSYRDISKSDSKEFETIMAKGFKTVYKPKKGGLRFAELLDQVALVDPELRIRFTSPHPKDFPDEVLEVIRKRENVCCSLHLPAQSGNNSVLERMRRGYTKESYLELVDHIREMLPGVTLSSDFICGFCGETDEEFEDTLSLIRSVKYHVAYLFAYSMREKTTAYRRFKDDVPTKVKQERLMAMVSAFREEAQKLNQSFIGQQQTILIEGESKRSDRFLAGRNDGNIKVIVPSVMTPAFDGADDTLPLNPGNYVRVEIEDANSQVLKGRPLYHTTLSNSNNKEINISQSQGNY